MWLGSKDGTLQEVHTAKKYMVMKISAIQRTTVQECVLLSPAYAEGKLTGKGFQNRKMYHWKLF